jgi:small ligand-binding sensory domain FIST
MVDDVNAPTAMVAGVGTSEAPDARAAGAEATRSALAQAGQTRSPDVVMVFSTARQDAVHLTEGIRDAVGDGPALFGGNANGVISNTFIGYDGFQVGVAALWFDGVDVQMFKEVGVAHREDELGNAFGKQIREALDAAWPSEDTALLFLYDSVNRTSGRFEMNLATPLIEGMNRHLSEWPSTAGARVMGDMKFNPTHQWFGNELLQDAAVALLLRGGVRMHTTVIHGCQPASAYHTITDSDGPTVLEIDGRPAMDQAAGLLGADMLDDHDHYKFFVTFGVNHGERWGDFVADNYANKMVVGVDPSRRGIVLAEPLATGTVFQFMRRNFEPAYTFDVATSLLDQIDAAGRTPVFGFYLNCAGRGAAYYGNDDEDAAHVQRAVAERFPLLGAYEAGEITSVNGQMQLLDWTGVFNVFSVQQP